MGKGKSKSRRQKNAAIAAAQKLSASGILPETQHSGANKKKKKRKGSQVPSEYDGMPRKMRELLQLKAFAERSSKEQLSKNNADQETDDDDEGQASASAVSAPGDGRGAADGAKGGRAETDTGGPGAKQQEVDGDSKPDRQQQRKSSQEAVVPPVAAAARKPKASQIKAKEWKKQKKLKQQMRKLGPVNELGDSEDEVEDTKPVEKVRFGEQAQMPPEFSLKQKSWTPEQQAARCTAIFQRQMEEAKVAAQQQTSVPNVGMMNAQDATLRLQLIDGYRNARKNQATRHSKVKGERGPATLQSLKALVKASSASASEGAERQ